MTITIILAASFYAIYWVIVFAIILLPHSNNIENEGDRKRREEQEAIEKRKKVIRENLEYLRKLEKETDDYFHIGKL